MTTPNKSSEGTKPSTAKSVKPTVKSLAEGAVKQGELIIEMQKQLLAFSELSQKQQDRIDKLENDLAISEAVSKKYSDLERRFTNTENLVKSIESTRSSVQNSLQSVQQAIARNSYTPEEKNRINIDIKKVSDTLLLLTNELEKTNSAVNRVHTSNSAMINEMQKRKNEIASLRDEVKENPPVGEILTGELSSTVSEEIPVRVQVALQVMGSVLAAEPKAALNNLGNIKSWYETADKFLNFNEGLIRGEDTSGRDTSGLDMQQQPLSTSLTNNNSF